MRNLFQTFIHFRDYLRLNEAIKEADRQHELCGSRFYVVPAAEGKLLVVDRRNFRALKQKSYISQRVNISDLIRESFYFTPYIDGSRRIRPEDEKRKQLEYYAWCSDYRKKAKAAAKGKFIKLKK